MSAWATLAVVLGRVIGLLVVIAVLYAIIEQPLTSAATVNSGLADLGSAGTSLTQFMSSVVGGSSAGSSSARSSSASSTSRAGTYTVRSGDTLSSIARAHGTSVSALAARNGIGNQDRISTGQQLSLR